MFADDEPDFLGAAVGDHGAGGMPVPQGEPFSFGPRGHRSKAQNALAHKMVAAKSRKRCHTQAEAHTKEMVQVVADP